MQDELPKIEFPCSDYPIKVIAISDDALEASVVEIVRAHDADFDATTVDLQYSRQRNYISVRMKITATGEIQL